MMIFKLERKVEEEDPALGNGEDGRSVKEDREVNLASF